MMNKPRGKHIALLLFVVLLCLPGREATGQLGIFRPGQDSLQIDELYDEALFMYRQALYTEALNRAEQALQISMRGESEQEQVKLMELMADIYMSSGNAASAIPYYVRTANIMEEARDTTGLLRVYGAMARLYHREGVCSKEMEYHQKILPLMKAAPGEELRGRKEQLGLAAYTCGAYDVAIETFRELTGMTGPGDVNEVVYRQHLIGAFDAAGMYDSALVRSEQLVPRIEARNDLRELAGVHNNIGYFMTVTGDTEGAAEAYATALQYAESAGMDPERVAMMKTNAGICHANMGNKARAAGFLNEAIGMLDETGAYAEKSRNQNIMANVYFEARDLYNAGQFSLDAAESAKRAPDRMREAEAYLTYSKVLREGNDPVNALIYYEKYLAIRDSIDIANQMEQQELENRRMMLEQRERDLRVSLQEEKVTELALQQLMLQNEKMEQERALLMQERNLQLLQQDSLRQSLIILEQESRVEEQERRNKILAQQNELAELRVQQEQQKQQQLEQENMLLEQQKRADQLEIERNQLEVERQKRRNRTVIAMAVLLLVLVISVLAGLISSRRKNYLLARQKKEIEEKNLDLEMKNEEISAQRDQIEQKNIDLEMKNEEISTQRDEIEAQRNLVFEQKELIEKSNEEVMKSIEYAKRIQAATLPPLLPLTDHVDGHFVLFRPRDIVSGDFYWYAHVEEKTVITVADCTGHGVPGAFMSMLGVSFLKELVQKEYITHPGVILRRLRKEVINTMGQKGISGEQRDGMDMALVAIDHNEMKLDFAGAYNSLYIVRTEDKPGPDPDITKSDEPMKLNGHVLYEIPADKMPIAHYEVMDKFNNYEIPVFRGDVIYLFTDGYADQFGGSRGKKLKYKPFKKMILELAHKPMEEQEKDLGKILDDWMGSHPQVDDICVMGIRI